MKPNDIWIERRSDGRHYYVRKKPDRSQLSLRQLLTEALPPRARSFFSRDSRHNNHIRCTNPEKPVVLPPPSSSTPVTTQEPTPPTTDLSSSQAQQLPQPVTMYHVPSSQDPSNPETAGTLTQSHGMPHPPFPLHSPPQIFPLSVPHPVLGQGLPFVPPQSFMGYQAPNFVPAPPPPPAPFVLPPPLAQLHHPQQLPTAGLSSCSDLRYKCDVCGRFRSTRFHRRYPIPPGTIPAKTICHRCREEATDTEEESTSDSYTSHVHRRRSSRAPSRNASSFRNTSPVRNARNRSRSRRGRVQSFYGRPLIETYQERRAGPPYSPQTSPIDLNSERISSRHGSRYRRQDSPEIELPTRFQTLKLVPQERIVYLESEDDHHVDTRYNRDHVRDDNARGLSGK